MCKEGDTLIIQAITPRSLLAVLDVAPFETPAELAYGAMG